MKEIPKFKSEDEERKFWETADSTKYIGWSQAKTKTLVKLRPSLRTISLRLPVAMIEDLKLLANQRDVPYQSLLKVFLAERLGERAAEKSHCEIDARPLYLLLLHRIDVVVKAEIRSRRVQEMVVQLVAAARFQRLP